MIWMHFTTALLLRMLVIVTELELQLVFIISCRLWGERVNLREQHDAFEFFNCLVDNLDEGLKSYGSKAKVSHVLGGSFADQKICKGCPHRYSVILDKWAGLSFALWL